MVVTLQSFLLQFCRFLSEYHKKHIKTTFYLNVTESQTPLEDVNMNCHQKKKRSIGSITRLSVVYSHISGLINRVIDVGKLAMYNTLSYLCRVILP